MAERTRFVIIVILGVISLIAVGGSIVLAFYEHATPDVIVTLGGVSVGALANSLTLKGSTSLDAMLGPEDHNG